MVERQMGRTPALSAAPQVGLWHYGGTLRLFGDPSATAPVPADLGAAIALPLYGGASPHRQPEHLRLHLVGLTEQLSLGLVNFGLALTS